MEYAAEATMAATFLLPLCDYACSQLIVLIGFGLLPILIVTPLALSWSNFRCLSDLTASHDRM